MRAIHRGKIPRLHIDLLSFRFVPALELPLRIKHIYNLLLLFGLFLKEAKK